MKINWKCVVSYINPSRNRVVRFLAKLGMESCNRLYTLDRPVGGVEELLDWGTRAWGFITQTIWTSLFQDAPDPVNFNVSMSLAEQVDDLGLGQINAPRMARMEMEVEELEELLDGAVEDSFVGSWGPKRSLFAHEPPLGDLD